MNIKLTTWTSDGRQMALQNIHNLMRFHIFQAIPFYYTFEISCLISEDVPLHFVIPPLTPSMTPVSPFSRRKLLKEQFPWLYFPIFRNKFLFLRTTRIFFYNLSVSVKLEIQLLFINSITLN